MFLSTFIIILLSLIFCAATVGYRTATVSYRTATVGYYILSRHYSEDRELTQSEDRFFDIRTK